MPQADRRGVAAACAGGFFGGFLFALLLVPEQDLPEPLARCAPLSGLRKSLDRAAQGIGEDERAQGSARPFAPELFHAGAPLRRSFKTLFVRLRAPGRWAEQAQPRTDNLVFAGLFPPAVAPRAFAEASLHDALSPAEKARAAAASPRAAATKTRALAAVPGPKNGPPAPALASPAAHPRQTQPRRGIEPDRPPSRRDPGFLNVRPLADDFKDARNPDFDGRRRGAAKGHVEPPGPAQEKTRREKPAGERAPRPIKPPTLRDWLGLALRPPQGRIEAPGFEALRAKTPASLPDGRPVDARPLAPREVERLRPPEEEPAYAKWREEDGLSRKAHWHESEGASYLHLGGAWGAADKNGRWSWMIRRDERWWTGAQGDLRLLWHADHWWWRTAEGWFMLHEGEPWAWRHFADWKREGLIHPGTGTRVVYSEDGLRAAVLTPGQEWAVFDARTGEPLARGELEAQLNGPTKEK